MAEPPVFAPPLTEVPLPARNVGALLRRNGLDAASAGRPALRFGDRVWTHAQLLLEAERFAEMYRARLDPDRPLHVAVLLDNTPDYAFALCGAGLVGVVVVGLNHTRRDEHLARDISHTDVQLVITEPRHQAVLEPAVEGLDLAGGILVSERFADGDDPPRSMGVSLEDALDSAGGWGGLGDGVGPVIEGECDPDVLWALLFTSGTSAAPKAVRCTQRRC
jgi:fatty-acyl-CoA synthase